MFEGWDGFYLLIGSAAAGLIGLLFVVTTLMSGIERPRALQAASLYTSPILFHFAVVLVISALTAVPRLPSPATGLIIGGCALVGMIYALRTASRLHNRASSSEAHWSDFWCYGVAPAAVYVGLGAAAAGIWISPRAAAYGVAPALLAVLLISIRNAWDMVTWLAPRGGAEPPAPAPATGETPVKLD